MPSRPSCATSPQVPPAPLGRQWRYPPLAPEPRRGCPSGPRSSRRAAGVWVSVAELGKALAARGLEVEIFGLADDCGAADRAGWDGPPLRLHHVVGGGAFGYAPRLARSLREGRLSLLHANGLWMYPSLASLRWSRRARRPYLIAPHGMLDPWAVAHSACASSMTNVTYAASGLSQSSVRTSLRCLATARSRPIAM